jgi:hypothetical protein
MKPNLLFLLALLLGTLGACRGARETVAEPPAPAPPPIPYALYEDFDLGRYPDPLPATEVEVRHDLPAVLVGPRPTLPEPPRTDRRVGPRTTRTLSGYRIQINSTVEKNEALRLEQIARSWEQGLSAAEQRTLQPYGSWQVYVRYHQPYFRVRVGDYATRAEAQRALTLVKRQFGNAFIVPDTVTITGGGDQ